MRVGTRTVYEDSQTQTMKVPNQFVYLVDRSRSHRSGKGETAREEEH